MGVSAELQQHGIKDVPTTSRNPQANAVCEHMHQTVANVLCTTVMLAPPQNLLQAHQYWICISNNNVCYMNICLSCLGHLTW